MKFPSATGPYKARRFKTANRAVRASQLNLIEKSDEPKTSTGTEGQVVQLRLLTQLQLLGDRLVAIHVSGLEIIQEATALADHHQQSTAGAMVLNILLEVLGKVVDALS
jgi:hypothetical protein